MPQLGSSWSVANRCCCWWLEAQVLSSAERTSPLATLTPQGTRLKIVAEMGRASRSLRWEPLSSVVRRLSRPCRWIAGSSLICGARQSRTFWPPGGDQRISWRGSTPWLGFIVLMWPADPAVAAAARGAWPGRLIRPLPPTSGCAHALVDGQPQRMGTIPTSARPGFSDPLWLPKLLPTRP